jgi:hypothetical protein
MSAAAPKGFLPADQVNFRDTNLLAYNAEMNIQE